MNVPLGLKFEELKEFMINRRFGRLVVTGYVGMDRSDRRWECACDCGKTCTRKTSNLREVKDHSCRCWGIEKCSTAGLKHGMHKTPEYATYHAMKSRCYNNKDPEFPRYGGRGIIICNRWLESFVNFFEDMGPRPFKNYSIDRINVNGNYEPSNCRWADPVTQSNNTRRNRFLVVDGITATMAEHCKRTGKSVHTVSWRLKKGQSHQEAFR